MLPDGISKLMKIVRSAVFRPLRAEAHTTNLFSKLLRNVSISMSNIEKIIG